VPSKLTLSKRLLHHDIPSLYDKCKCPKLREFCSWFSASSSLYWNYVISTWNNYGSQKTHPQTVTAKKYFTIFFTTLISNTSKLLIIEKRIISTDFTCSAPKQKLPHLHAKVLSEIVPFIWLKQSHLAKVCISNNLSVNVHATGWPEWNSPTFYESEQRFNIPLDTL